MRRKPVAVYRVIDEDELLGGDGFEVSDAGGEPSAAATIQRQPLAGLGWRVRSDQRSWITTVLAIAALVGVAVLLLSSQTRARPSAASTAGRHSGVLALRSARAALSVRAPLRASTKRAERPRVAQALPHGARGSTRRPAATRSARRPARRARRVVEGTPVDRTLGAGSASLQAPRSPNPPPAPAAAPNQEFGFER